MRRSPCREEVWPFTSSAFRYQNRQQDRSVRPCQCHRSEARLSQCIGLSPSRSRGTRHLPFVVCIAQQLSPPSSWPPSLGPVLLAAPLDALTPIIGTMRPLTAATPQLSGSSPRFLRHTFPSFHPQARDAPRHRFSRHSSVPSYFQTSPLTRKLVATPRRIGFVILPTDSSPPVASHPASQRRSYLQLRSRGTLRHGLPPCKCGALAGARVSLR
jgi:hypothetical protein